MGRYVRHCSWQQGGGRVRFPKARAAQVRGDVAGSEHGERCHNSSLQCNEHYQPEEVRAGAAINATLSEPGATATLSRLLINELEPKWLQMVLV